MSELDLFRLWAVSSIIPMGLLLLAAIVTLRKRGRDIYRLSHQKFRYPPPD